VERNEANDFKGIIWKLMCIWADNIKMNIKGTSLFIDLLLHYNTGQSSFSI
jgi:hypothetical protein